MDSFIYVLIGIFLFSVLGIGLDVLWAALKTRAAKPEQTEADSFTLLADPVYPLMMVRNAPSEERYLN